MKKFVLWTALLFGFIFSGVTAYGAVSVANAVTTDITASINGAAIPCCNLYGQVCIFAEDLKDYGFQVSRSEDGSTLDIRYAEDGSIPITATYVPPQNKSVGQFAYRVSPCNVTVTVDGNKMSSFAADGKTLIYLNALKPYGDVVWNPKNRTAAFTSVSKWTYSIPTVDTPAPNASISDFALTLTDNGGGNFHSTGRNMEYLTDARLTGGRTPYVALEFSLYMDVEEQTAPLYRLLQQMLNASFDQWITNDTTFANEHMNVIINGESVPVTWVSKTVGNGHSDYRFIFGKQVKTLEELDSISILCG